MRVKSSLFTEGVIKFSKFSKTEIRKFAGDIIFSRGEKYYEDGLVQEFEYDPETKKISAEIEGNFGTYRIELWNKNGRLEADCDCPYDGYPCKHIVAVLLYDLHNRSQYLKALQSEKDTEEKIRSRLSEWSGQDLIELIITSMKEYPPFKRDILTRLAIDKENLQKLFFRQIDKIRREFDKDRFSTYEISRDFKKILKDAEKTDPQIRIETLWKITDCILYQLNEYGMDDEPLENLAMENLDTLTGLFGEYPDFGELWGKIRKALDGYEEQGNCGIVDEICEAAYALSDQNEAQPLDKTD